MYMSRYVLVVCVSCYVCLSLTLSAGSVEGYDDVIISDRAVQDQLKDQQVSMPTAN